MRIVNEHNCGRRHRSVRYFARCAFPGLASITGTGQLAVVSTCCDATVALFEQLRPAQLHFQELQVFGCCRTCSKQHVLVALDYDGPPAEPAAVTPVVIAA